MPDSMDLAIAGIPARVAGIAVRVDFSELSGSRVAALALQADVETVVDPAGALAVIECLYRFGRMARRALVFGVTRGARLVVFER